MTLLGIYSDSDRAMDSMDHKLCSGSMPFTNSDLVAFPRTTIYTRLHHQMRQSILRLCAPARIVEITSSIWASLAGWHTHEWTLLTIKVFTRRYGHWKTFLESRPCMPCVSRLQRFGIRQVLAHKNWAQYCSDHYQSPGQGEEQLLSYSYINGCATVLDIFSYEPLGMKTSVNEQQDTTIVHNLIWNNRSSTAETVPVLQLQSKAISSLSSYVWTPMWSCWEQLTILNHRQTRAQDLFKVLNASILYVLCAPEWYDDAIVMKWFEH